MDISLNKEQVAEAFKELNFSTKEILKIVTANSTYEEDAELAELLVRELLKRGKKSLLADIEEILIDY